jgi:hypothetical protein
MDSKEYLRVNKYGYFYNDWNISRVDIDKLILNKQIQAGNIETGEWYDDELDVSDIAPGLLFTVINNSYSSGFGLFIPLDMSIDDFSKRVATTLINKSIPNFNGASLIDFEYLNKTGKIRSTRKWNKNAAQKGLIWINNGKAIHTIQSIVDACRELQRITNN